MKEGILFTYGQAQKWINMTIKFLYILEYNPFEVVFPYLHVPLDNYVFDIAESLLDIPRPDLAWSKIDSYEDYMAYENALRNAITDRPPLRWEFENWLRQIEKNTSH